MLTSIDNVSYLLAIQAQPLGYVYFRTGWLFWRRHCPLSLLFDPAVSEGEKVSQSFQGICIPTQTTCSWDPNKWRPFKTVLLLTAAAFGLDYAGAVNTPASVKLVF
jgi:hypothetical protein